MEITPAERKDITLDKILDMARLHESAESQAKQIEHDGGVTSVNGIQSSPRITGARH